MFNTQLHYFSRPDNISLSVCLSRFASLGLEVKNERGAFMSITAPNAEARVAAPLPSKGNRREEKNGVVVFAKQLVLVVLTRVVC